jgi:3-phenylpropionate/trans-cinnamate dioxygenase ferredoxin reductase subunit
MARQRGTIVIGGGQAGAETVFALRAQRYDRPVTLLCAERHLPYERPPLSKGALEGSMDPERLLIRSARAYAAKGIKVQLGVHVTDIDRSARTVVTDSGEVLEFESLVLATGADAIRPEWGLVEKVHTIRTLDDAQAVSAYAGGRVAVIGGSFLGLEVASSLSKTADSIVVVEAAEQVLPGRVSSYTSDRVRRLHEERGVRFVMGERVEAIRHDARGCLVIEMLSGVQLEVDWAVLAIGARPRDELAHQCGIETARGVLIDAQCRTSDPHIYAVGDVAIEQDNNGAIARVESVASAMAQARTAAAAIVGAELPTRRPETFWSEQFGTQLRIAGMVGAAHTVVDSICEPNDGGFVVRRTHDEELVALEAFENPREFTLGLRELTLSTSARWFK